MTYTVTPIQAAALIGVTPTTVRRWIASGELDARKVGPRRWLIAVESVESLRLGTPARPVTPAPAAPVVDLAELAADITIALGDIAIAAAAVREARTAPRPNSPAVGHRRADLALEHARRTLHAALDRLPPRSP
jgi:excisionase family DNA binding protein